MAIDQEGVNALADALAERLGRGGETSRLRAKLAQAHALAAAQRQRLQAADALAAAVRRVVQAQLDALQPAGTVGVHVWALRVEHAERQAMLEVIALAEKVGGE